jgi:hypothetical protein
MSDRSEMIVLIIVLLAAVGAIYMILPKCTLDSTVTPIFSLSDGALVHGDFMLGSGSVNSVPSYIYYTRAGGGYILNTVPASRSIIYMDEQTSPFVVKTANSCKTAGFPATYVFHIPNGSVVNRYNLDSNL